MHNFTFTYTEFLILPSQPPDVLVKLFTVFILIPDLSKLIPLMNFAISFHSQVRYEYTEHHTSQQ